MLLILDLKLMKIDKLEIITHLLLVLDLSFGFPNLSLERPVLEGQLSNEGILCSLLVFHVFNELLGIVFSSSSILCCAQETTEVEGFLTDLSNSQIGALEDGLETFQ